MHSPMHPAVHLSFDRKQEVPGREVEDMVKAADLLQGKVGRDVCSAASVVSLHGSHHLWHCLAEEPINAPLGAKGLVACRVRDAQLGTVYQDVHIFKGWGGEMAWK